MVATPPESSDLRWIFPSVEDGATVTMDEQERAEKLEELQARMDVVRAQNAKAKALQEKADQERRDAILAALEAGMSQSEIARQLGLTQQAVSKIIKNV